MTTGTLIDCNGGGGGIYWHFLGTDPEGRRGRGLGGVPQSAKIVKEATVTCK